jgi:geranylgeranyl pyrophosphate synthase
MDAVLERYLPTATDVPGRIHESMRWSALAPGKRLRPALVYATGQALGADPALLDAPAAALELIHAFSLVHDDLPAMDDDDLRRGRPTNHRQFDEATAILAGDALCCLAFEVLARELPASDLVRPMIATLGEATGTRGMIGGQVLDLLAENGPKDLAVVRAIHVRKTGALIRAACTMGAIAARAEPQALRACTAYGEHLGLAFQITDDILDETSTAEQLGKATRKDMERGKLTWPAAVGLENARTDAFRFAEEACRVIAPYDREGMLAAIANWVSGRDH